MKRWSILTVLLCVLVLSSCTWFESVGSLTVKIEVPTDLNAVSAVVKITPTVEDSTNDMTKNCNIANGAGSVNFERLKPGTWEVNVEVKTATGETVGTGMTTALVVGKQTQTVTVKINAYGSLQGTVVFVDQSDHSGIQVKVAGLTSTTDANGNYLFAQVPVGNHIVTASYNGYFENNTVVEIIKNTQTTAAPLTLYPIQNTGSIEGTAKYIDKTDHRGIIIIIQTLDGQQLPSLVAETDTNGHFSFPHVPVDPATGTATYILTALTLNDPIYGTDSQQVTVNLNQNTVIQTEFILRYAGVELMIFADDTTPWDSNALETMLQSLNQPYIILGSADMATVTLPLNKIVWIINDQPQAFYNEYYVNQAKFDEFVSNGGTMLFEACDMGWNSGSLLDTGATMPGGVKNNFAYFNDNTVVNQTHPMMQGVPVNLQGTYASHNWFSELPAEHTVLTVDPNQNPTLVEYRYDKGRVVATGQPLEYHYVRDQNPKTIYPNLVYYTFNLPIPEPEPVVAGKQEGNWALSGYSK